MHKSRLISWNSRYLPKIFSWRKLETTQVGQLYQVEGYTEYNRLIDINSIFSSNPSGEITDRTNQTRSPFNVLIRRPWTIPTTQYNLDQALEERVKSLLRCNMKLNLFWSGGIDSTTMVTAFLKHTPNKSQIRLLYSPNSVYEHPCYLNFMKNFSEIELVDISGTTYLTEKYDGLFITGDSGDELNASIDESFLQLHGSYKLGANWRDLFFAKIPNSQFIDFCENHFSSSGRPIDTVLQARWWFYATCKTNSVMWQKLPWFFNYNNFDFDNFQGFFDCAEYENYIYWNIEEVLLINSYSSWKHHLRDYCYKFDNLKDWYGTKVKTHSKQLHQYVNKKCAITDHRWLGVLSDGTRLHTPSMPLVSIKELNLTYGNSLDYIFNESY